MSIIGYILHRIKDFLFGNTWPDHYRVHCWKCGKDIVLTSGLEREELGQHFETPEHKAGENR